MRAWHFVGTHKPFERVDIEEPTAGPGKVVVDVKAAGLCHSDVGILEDEKWLTNMKELPVVRRDPDRIELLFECRWPPRYWKHDLRNRHRRPRDSAGRGARGRPRVARCRDSRRLAE